MAHLLLLRNQDLITKWSLNDLPSVRQPDVAVFSLGAAIPKFLANDSLSDCAAGRENVTIQITQDTFISPCVRNTNDLFSSRRRLARHVISAFFFVPRSSKRVLVEKDMQEYMYMLSCNKWNIFALKSVLWVGLKPLQQKLISILAIVRCLHGKSTTGSSLVLKIPPSPFRQLPTNSL